MADTPPALPGSQDEDYLKSLSLAYYIVGGILAFFSLMPIMHMVMGLLILTGGLEQMTNDMANANPPFPFPPKLFGWLFFFGGTFFVIFGEAVAISIICAGRFIKQRRNYTFTFVIACIACVFFPIGTALGIFTIILLTRPNVKSLYGKS
ncbi:hypothetical protein [Cerasicoccus arenae]|uniref:Transmembrane protein n=1 Tax=Cerasicoccus arenae TaxID=424488 RepID=A0A8J3GCQ5_9BACT|nr:hypothetical protein [Cerasicoccus arenae]MBK1856992.1 hypothetical protein [Cerasicoccus arenae]GHB90278.1 hypothetical protein GCM10007047_01170 [Cerasicoccus arenae]